jgi:threonine dehydrogenase-like Zn-dependent dehydrogenase
MVVVLEKQTHRAEFAKQYCADHVFVNPPREVGEQTLAYSRRVGREIIEGVPGLRRGFDVCIEAAGAEECMQMGLILCRPGGCCRSFPAWGKLSRYEANEKTTTDMMDRPQMSKLEFHLRKLLRFP